MGEVRHTSASHRREVDLVLEELCPRRLHPPIKIHGGKYYLTPWLVDCLPVDYMSRTHVELFTGAGSFLINRPSGVPAIAGDKDEWLISMWRSIKSCPTTMQSILRGMQYDEPTFKKYRTHRSWLGRFVRGRMSRGGLGSDFAWSDRTRGGEPGDVHAWTNAIERLVDVSARVQNTEFYNTGWHETLNLAEDTGRPLFIYADPPYVHSTRTAGFYEHEMEEQDHVDLLTRLKQISDKHPVLISGYRCDLYDVILKDWTRLDKEVPNHASQAKEKRIMVESVWRNY